MDNQSAAHPSPSALIRLWPWFVLLLILLFVGFIRFRLLDMPLERDEGEYAYAGQLILQGIPPYELAYNMKLPGTYYGCALGMALFGQTIAGIHATLIVVNSLTIIFVFLLARKLFGVVAALVSAASYALMSISPLDLGMATHATQFVVLFAVPATLLMWKGCETGSRKFLFFGGLLYGLAFLMKQQGVVFCAFGGAYLVWDGVRKRNFAGLAKAIFTYGAGVFLPYICLCLLMAWDGVFSRFWFWTFTYAHSYVGLVSWSQGFRWLFVHLSAGLAWSAGFWLLGIMGLLLGLREKTLCHRTHFVALLWMFSFLGTAAGLYFRGHYFILLLPAFSLLVGLGVDLLQKASFFRMPANLCKIIVLSLFAASLVWNVYAMRLFFFSMSGDEVNRVIYNGFPFVEAVLVSDYIREHARPDAKIAIIGSEPEIFFYTHRHSATGYIYIYALTEPQPNARSMQLDMIHEIESARPEYLIWVGFTNSWIFSPPPDAPLPQWADQYIHKLYVKTGVVDTQPDGTIHYFWDKDAVNYHPAGEHITVFKRRDEADRDEADIPPKKN